MVEASLAVEQIGLPSLTPGGDAPSMDGYVLDDHCAPVQTKATCAEGVVAEEQFANDMIGCAGTVHFADRNSLCGEGSSPCSAQQWVVRRAGAVPNYHYWTNDDLKYYSTWPNIAPVPNGGCLVSTELQGADFCTPDEPMRVCAPGVPNVWYYDGSSDPLGNMCNWTECGYETLSNPVEHFGGCLGNPTAGTLCCR